MQYHIFLNNLYTLTLYTLPSKYNYKPYLIHPFSCLLFYSGVPAPVVMSHKMRSGGMICLF